MAGETKFFITAPFMIVGARPARSRIHPSIAVTVDLPLVPATAEQVALITDDLAEAGVPLARAHEVHAVGGLAPGERQHHLPRRRGGERQPRR